ncbi:hypothetical protein TNCV_4025871 [Trichonephila clavipes]|nr:hypothetical protein TNCV_4025871 [Trichonephila clavipes]
MLGGSPGIRRTQFKDGCRSHTDVLRNGSYAPLVRTYRPSQEDLTAVFQECDRCHLRRIVRQNKDSTVLQLTQIVNQGSFQQISARTIHRKLQRIEMHSQVPVRKPLIPTRIAKIRLQWCRQRKH